MRTPAATHVVIAMMMIFAPVVATSVVCVEDGGTDRCGLDCAVCLCCSHGPATFLTAAIGHSNRGQEGLAPDVEAADPASFSRGILHVPRPSAVH